MTFLLAIKAIAIKRPRRGAGAFAGCAALETAVVAEHRHQLVAPLVTLLLQSLDGALEGVRRFGILVSHRVDGHRLAFAPHLFLAAEGACVVT